ncbi:MAG: AAA family ATPase [Paludibacter sp.]
MKRITHVKLNNYRAFFGEYDLLDFPNGENVLIYGENGSGKSSIYKALKDFFASSENPGSKFWSNIYARITPNGDADGEVEVTFNDYPVVNIVNAHTYQFTNILPQNNAYTQSFIKKANKAKGFLSYQELVKSYVLPKEESPNPNLYNFIIDNLLSEYNLQGPNVSGVTIQDFWKSLEADLKINSARFKKFRDAKDQLPRLEEDLVNILRPLLIKTNDFLDYFSNSKTKIDLNSLIIKPYKFKDGKGWWFDKVFRLNVLVNNENIVNGYQNHLNEARLSAIASCLYLAAIKLNPQPDEYKILFLDDVFIGLDTSNRLPLLELLKAEFPEHQIFISTYDRFWYETANRWLESNMSEKWKCFEMYVNHREHLPTKSFDKPIITTTSTNWERGIFYLHHETNPDYPSAANAFRKHFEKLLKDYIPDYESRNVSNERIDDYRLSKLSTIATDFFQKVGASDIYLKPLIGSLPTLLHPLSHYEITSPLYKGELLRISDNLKQFEDQLKTLDFKVKYKNALSKGKIVRMTYIIAPNHTSHYYLYLNQNLCKTEIAGTITFVGSNCNYEKCYGINAGAKVSLRSYKKTDIRFRFKTLEEAYVNTHIYLVALPDPGFSTIPLKPDYVDAFEYSNDGTIWQPLRGLLT